MLPLAFSLSLGLACTCCVVFGLARDDRLSRRVAWLLLAVPLIHLCLMEAS